MNKYTKITKAIALLVIVSVILTVFPLKSTADDKDRPKIMVSLGDSYSAGEGIEPFYGQEKSSASKVTDQDWLSHRSQRSWPGLLELPGNDGNMASEANKDYWYFVAVSGATTYDLEHKQKKDYNYDGLRDYKYIDAQFDVFNNLYGEVDYVTMTMGGNDVGFADVVTDCITGGIPFVNIGNLDDRLNTTWKHFDNPYVDDNGNNQIAIKDKLKNAYKSIEQKAGPQAHIIIAGYPQLLSNESDHGFGGYFSEDEVNKVNENVRIFNIRLEEIVNSCRAEGMDIYFVSVEDVFAGHGAYSKDPYINEVMFSQQQDLDRTFYKPSAYSIHPNAQGAQAYAACVQAKIDEIETGVATGIDLSKIKKDMPTADDLLLMAWSWFMEQLDMAVEDYLADLEIKLSEFLMENCDNCN